MKKTVNTIFMLAGLILILCISGCGRAHDNPNAGKTGSGISESVGPSGAVKENTGDNKQNGDAPDKPENGNLLSDDKANDESGRNGTGKDGTEGKSEPSDTPGTEDGNEDKDSFNSEGSGDGRTAESSHDTGNPEKDDKSENGDKLGNENPDKNNPDDGKGGKKENRDKSAETDLPGSGDSDGSSQSPDTEKDKDKQGNAGEDEDGRKQEQSGKTEDKNASGGKGGKENQTDTGSGEGSGSQTDGQKDNSNPDETGKDTDKGGEKDEQGTDSKDSGSEENTDNPDAGAGTAGESTGADGPDIEYRSGFDRFTDSTMLQETFLAKVPGFNYGSFERYYSEQYFDYAVYGKVSLREASFYISVLKANGFDSDVMLLETEDRRIYYATNAGNLSVRLEYENGELTLGVGWYTAENVLPNALSTAFENSELKYLPAFTEGSFVRLNESGKTAYIVIRYAGEDYVRLYIDMLKGTGFVNAQDSGEENGIIWYNASDSSGRVCDLIWFEGVLKLGIE